MFQKFQRLCIYAGLSLTAVASSVNAQQLDSFAPEKVVTLYETAANAEKILFLLTYALQPMCDSDHSVWSYGGSGYVVAPQREVKSFGRIAAYLESVNRQNLFVQEKFGAKPGQKVLLADQPSSPLGLSGLKKGDVFSLAEEVPKKSEIEPQKAGETTVAPVSTESSGSEGRAERRKRIAEAAHKKYSDNPVQELVIWKDGVQSAAKVRMVNKCGLGVLAKESRYSYAHSSKGQLTDGNLIVTLPFIEAASSAELKTMLALEAAHYALGYSDVSLGVEVFSAFFLGRIGDIGKNVETGVRPTIEKDLIQVDRLALSLAQELGVSAMEYLDALKKFDAARTGIGQPDYAQTRPLGPLRIEALQAAIAAKNADQPIVRAEKMSEETYSNVMARMKSVATNSEALFSLPAAQAIAKQ